MLHPLIGATYSSTVTDEQSNLFRQEVEVLGRCTHANVVRLLGTGLVPPLPFLVLEHMPMSLHDLIYDAAQPLPLEKVLRIGRDVACGLAYLHPTVIHRDLKPRNILLDGPDATSVKICDFGLARLTMGTLLTAHPEAGTAPCECLRGVEGPLTCIWCLPSLQLTPCLPLHALLPCPFAFHFECAQTWRPR